MRLGGYEVQQEIGRGGMGVVYRARADDGREVAVKVLLRTDPDAIAGFERERRIIASFAQADGFVPILDAGEAAGKRWLAMPYLPGGTLRERLGKGPLPVAEAVGLVRALARALGKAHERGIVHRDLKPENVLYTARGEPLVADLGLAKHFRRDVLGASQSRPLSDTGMIAGTPGYMAPEQIDDATKAGPTADVFALGAILHECLTGERAFRGASLFEYAAALQRGRKKPASAPAWLAGIVARALAEDPSARYPDGASLAEALEAHVTPSKRPLVIAGAFVAVLAGSSILVRASARDDVMSTRVPAPPPPPAASDEAQRLNESAYRKLADHDAAGACSDAARAIELAPGRADAWVARGLARRLTGDPEGAIGDMTHAIELAPTLARAWSNRASFRLEAGELEGAIADATRSVELDARWFEAWMVRGQARCASHDFVGAISDATRAIELRRDAHEAWRTRGLARFLNGDIEGAAEDEKQGIELVPKKNASELRSFGDGCVAAGDKAGAAAAYRRFLAIAPDHPDAPHVRAQLDDLGP